MRGEASLVLLLLISGCGYHWGFDYPEGRRPSVSIPYVKGDDDGSLTNELISQLSSSGLVVVRNHSGEYRLNVSILENQNDSIGYRRDPQRIKNKIYHQLQACEGRRRLVTEVSLCKGEEIVSGPHKIAADVDYDYVDGDSYPQLTFVSSHGETEVVLPFSLGQLESIEAAQEASTRPLYRKISQKIVDAISSEW